MSRLLNNTANIKPGDKHILHLFVMEIGIQTHKLQAINGSNRN